MKKLIVEYLGYKLEVEIHPKLNGISFIKGTCKNLCFNFCGYYGSYSPAIDEFIKVVDREYEEEVRNEALAFRD